MRAIRKFSRNVTIKGGVVMRSLTGNVRRATQDMDLDFIRYSLSESSIREFIEKLNCLDGITITIAGDIEELSQQEHWQMIPATHFSAKLTLVYINRFKSSRMNTALMYVWMMWEQVF